LPSGFWIATFALIISYIVDKYMLLRRWVRKPEYGTELPDAAQAAIFMCLLAGLYMSMYFYAGWPFDYACSANDNPAGPFWHCERNSDERFWNYVWPHVQGYMTHGQKQLIKIYRSVDAIVALTFIIGFLATPFYYFFYDLLIGREYDPVGDDRDVPFILNDEIQAYVPVCTHPGLDLPVIGVQVGAMKEFPNASVIPGHAPFVTTLIYFQHPRGHQYDQYSMLQDEFMLDNPAMMKFSLKAGPEGFPAYYSRVKGYDDLDQKEVYIEVVEEEPCCVCLVGGQGSCMRTVARCCTCSFCLLTTIAFVFICLALALMHICKHVDVSSVDSFEVPDTAFVDELLMANDSPNGEIQVVRTHFKRSGSGAAYQADDFTAYQDTVQVVAVNYARDLALSQGITKFDASVFRNEYSYEEFASVTAFTEFASNYRVLGYNLDCKTVDMMARIPQQLPSLRRVVARAGWQTNVMFEMQDPYTLEVVTAFESVNITADTGDVEIKGLRTEPWGIVSIETELQNDKVGALKGSNVKDHQVVDLFNVQPNVLTVNTIMADVKMERIWMYDGGLLKVSTQGGEVDLSNIVMFGHYGSIVVETYSAPITITLNARYFNGAFNLQSARGLVYVDPGQFMAYEGGSPEECSESTSWNGMPVLRPDVPGHHSHCLQGRLGMAAGYNRLIAYSVHGNITVQFASFVEQPPGMYI